MRIYKWLILAPLIALAPQLCPSQPLTEVGHYGENIGAVAVDGQWGVFNEGTRIRVMDLTNPAVPVYRGSVDIRMIPYCLVLRGTTAFSASQCGMVHIVDITNPDAPAVLSFLADASFCWPSSLWVRSQSDYGYVNASGGITVLDVNNKQSPTVVRTLTANMNYGVNSIIGQGSYLYAVESNYGTSSTLHIWSLGNPSYPNYQGHCSFPESAFMVTNGLAVYGNTAYVATSGGTYVVDITSHTNPSVVSKIDTTYGERLSVSQGLLHAASWNVTRIWDLTNPTAPLLLRSIDTYPSNDVSQIAAQGDYDYSARQHTLFATRTSVNPPVITATRTVTPGIGYCDSGMAVRQNALFFSAMPGIVSVDITSPDSPHLLQKIGFRGSDDMTIVDSYLYNIGWGYIEIWDISNPADMQMVDEYPLQTTDQQKLAICGSLAAACGSGSVFLFTRESDGRLTPASSFTPAGDIRAVALKDSALYALGYDGNLKTYDVTDPTSPSFVKEITIMPPPYYDQGMLGMRLCVQNANLHALLPRRGYFLINVQNQFNPVLIASLMNPQTDVGGIWPAGNKLYLTTGGWCGTLSDGLRALDLAGLPNVNEIGRTGGVDWVGGGVVANGRLFVSTQRGGLRVYETYPVTNLPPIAPTGHPVLAYSITTPSTDPEGANVNYTYRWSSDKGDVVVHGPTTATDDILTEWQLVQSGETWTVTVTPNDGTQDGPVATGRIRIVNEQGSAASWLLY